MLNLYAMIFLKSSWNRSNAFLLIVFITTTYRSRKPHRPLNSKDLNELESYSEGRQEAKVDSMRNLAFERRCYSHVHTSLSRDATIDTVRARLERVLSVARPSLF